MNIDRSLDARQSRRLASDDRVLARLERKEAAADALIGVLIREGKEVFYVNARNGKTRESQSRYALVDFLIRNQYV